MKIQPGFVLKTVSGKHIIIPTGTASLHFQGMITINATGKYLFEALQEEVGEQDLVTLITTKYEVGVEQASKDVQSFISLLQKHHIVG